VKFSLSLVGKFFARIFSKPFPPSKLEHTSFYGLVVNKMMGKLAQVVTGSQLTSY